MPFSPGYCRHENDVIWPAGTSRAASKTKDQADQLGSAPSNGAFCATLQETLSNLVDEALAVDDNPLVTVDRHDLRVAVRLAGVVDEAGKVAHFSRIDHLKPQNSSKTPYSNPRCPHQYGRDSCYRFLASRSSSPYNRQPRNGSENSVKFQ